MLPRARPLCGLLRNPLCMLRAVVLTPAAPAARRGGAQRAYSSSTAAAVRSALTLANLRAYAPQLGAGLGGLLAIYGVTTLAYHVTLSFLHIDISLAFRYGLATGGLCAAGLAGAGAVVYRRSVASPAALQRLALLHLQRSASVRAVLGSRFAPGSLRAVAQSPGHLSVGGSTRLGYVQPRVSLLFDVQGERGQGMVVAEGLRHPTGALVLTQLVLDHTPVGGTAAAAELLVIKGSEEALRTRGCLRGFLQGAPVRALPQDRAPTDEARLAEQAALPATAPEDEPGFLPREGSGGRA